MAKGINNQKSSSLANLGLKGKLWLATDILRSNMDAVEYKQVVLGGLIFLKYISYPAVCSEIIGAMAVAVPSEKKKPQEFHRICDPLYEQAEANRTQSLTIATLRDMLLPRLLSGELWALTVATIP